MNYEILFFACAGVCFVGILSNIVALQPSDYGNFTKNGPLRLSLYISTVKTRLIRQRAKKSFVIPARLLVFLYLSLPLQAWLFPFDAAITSKIIFFLNAPVVAVLSVYTALTHSLLVSTDEASKEEIDEFISSINGTPGFDYLMYLLKKDPKNCLTKLDIELYLEHAKRFNQNSASTLRKELIIE